MAPNNEGSNASEYPPKKTGTASVKDDTQNLEKFPTLKVPPGFHKSKSVTAAEVMASMTDEQVAFLNRRLKIEEPPLSLVQARERRASITKQRKDSITLIRNRTASRASNLGVRPTLKEMGIQEATRQA